MLLDLPGYTLGYLAHEGSATLLYRGRRDADGVPVAVKVTRNEFPTCKELARLRREFAILKELGDTDGVVRAYALEKCGRGLALAMEDLGACSLHHVLDGRSLGVEETLKVAISLADTLESLHGSAIIHKDIKPHNIMIDEVTGAPRFVDFGISARLSRESLEATSAALLEGTPAYMSPEQTGRMNRPVDLRTDLYSLGVTLYEMLTGAPPFASAEPVELIHSHIARTPLPPHERAREVPQALSDVVMKLLAKTPEDRYQSARGLKADLARCLSQWTAARQIERFPLGQEDVTGELRIPQKLYGRERDVEVLLLAFERVRKGATELILLSGYSGVGKSALVSELHKPIARRGGAFIRGKFDPIHRDVPLAPLAHALRELIRQALTESASALESLRNALLETLGSNGRLLFDLVPELELVLGPQPEVAALGPSETRNRFDLLMQRFVRVFARPEHPLALFLDDLQWADPASLRLLSMLLGDPDSKHLLILGAYRDNEVDAAHPLLSTLEALRKAGATISEIKLQPLSPPTVAALLAETLRKEEREVEALSALMFDKTQGNPFFLSQLLGAIHEERLLWFDAASGGFDWDLGRIRGTRATDNVVDFMLGKLQRLSPSTRRTLSLSACIGHAFDLATLATIHQSSPGKAAADLWEALREGLVVPLDGDYRLLDTSAGAAAEPAAAEPAAIDWQVSYRFLHDRVQEAAYALIEGEQKVEVHLSIARLLWERSGEPPRDEHLLEIVRHLRQSAPTIVDAAERRKVARLYLRAGRKAKAATAYKAADDHFAAGVDLLGSGGWEHEVALCFDLHLEGAEAAYLSGAIERAESLFEVLLPRASSRLEQARVYQLRVILLTALGKFSDALKAGRAGLEVFGVTLPEATEVESVFGRELVEAAATLGDRRIEDVVHAPALDDPALKAVLELLAELILPLYHIDPSLVGVVTLKIVNISLTHGPSDVSAFGYGMYSFVLTAVLGRPIEGHAFGKLALALHERFPNIAFTGKLYGSLAATSYHAEPVSTMISYYRRGWKAALEAGDFLWLAGAYYSMIICELTAGNQLDELRDEVEKALVVLPRTQDDLAVTVVTIARQVIASLQGRTRGRSSLSDDGFDEDRLVAKLQGNEFGLALCVYHFFKLMLHHLHGEHEAALAAAELAERASVHAAGTYHAKQIHFYACLSQLSLPAAGTPEEEARREASVARHKAEIVRLTADHADNFQHQLFLIEAEQARRAGKHVEAMDLYDQAITLAKENEFPHTEALANELCAKFHVSIGRSRSARSYVNDAHLGYLHWGASAKAEEIAREHGHLLLSRSGRGRRSPTAAASSSSSSSSSSVTTTTLLGETIAGNLRDAALIVRAAQAIAGENMLEKVIERLSKIVLESAGAERGALLLERKGQLLVEATFEHDSELLHLGVGATLDTRYGIAQSVALFVARTRERVIIDDAGEDGRFAADPYFVASRAMSVLCLPLLYQDRLIGLLYLENKKVSAAFHKARVELLELISSQAAIAIENAQLVAEVRAANLEVHRVNDRLEADVEQRTEQLRISNQRLELELVEREQAERRREQAEWERAAMKEQMIEVQRARLSEMSTPLIPITDRIMVMPLIGTVDTERAAQVLEVALEGAQRHQARVVILDVTGIKQIDTHVVRALLDCANALRLLGAQAVLTGIRAEVAQTMVAIGVDLGMIVTKSTLQSGIAHALKLSGEAVAVPSSCRCIPSERTPRSNSFVPQGASFRGARGAR